MRLFTPRDWQTNCHERFLQVSSKKKTFMLEACPGAGKSAGSGMMARTLRDQGIDHIIAIVPSTTIRAGVSRAWQELFDFRVRDELLRRTDRMPSPPWALDATVTTYHEIANTEVPLRALRSWHNDGWKFAVIFDEVHHAQDTASWGARVKEIADLAERVIVMTGTPFRTDGQPIALLEYVNGIAESDFLYSYREGVKDQVVRPIVCRYFDGRVLLSDRDRGAYEKGITDVSELEVRAAARRFFDSRGPVMEELVAQVASDLQATRLEFPDAAALFVVRPGRAGEEVRHVHAVANLIRRITHEKPVVVTYDRPDAAAKIEAFKKDRHPFIVAVNMVSEGTDIPRIRKVAFMRYTDSEMLFRQIAGRSMRVTHPGHHDPGTLYVPRFPKMVQFAQRLWDDAEAGLKEKREGGEIQPGEENGEPRIIALDAEGKAAGGQVGRSEVGDRYCFLAEHVKGSHEVHRSQETTVLGHLLQTLETSGLGVLEDPEWIQHPHTMRHRDNLVRKLRWRTESLAGLLREPFDQVWAREVHGRFHVRDIEEIKDTWSEDRIAAAVNRLERRIVETHQGKE